MFKWRQTEPGLILCAARWYLRYSLSFRDVEELLRERGLEADHTTIWRWVQRYGPELEERLRHPRLRGHAHDPEGTGEVGERFGRSATDSVHPQAVRGGGMRRSPADSTNRSRAAFGKLQHIRL